jgi:hypothetical protein
MTSLAAIGPRNTILQGGAPTGRASLADAMSFVDHAPVVRGHALSNHLTTTCQPIRLSAGMTAGSEVEALAHGANVDTAARFSIVTSSKGGDYRNKRHCRGSNNQDIPHGASFPRLSWQENALTPEKVPIQFCKHDRAGR